MNAKSKHAKNFLTQLPKNIFSGFVVSLIALPLGLGLALASEAPPISGIIAALVGGIVVSVLGGSNVTITGPGNGMVIVLLGAITTLGEGDMYQGYLFTLAAVVFSGILQIILGFLKMGKLADFFPTSAIEGMLAAIGLGILSKQFHVMIGNNNINGSIVSLLGNIPNSIILLFQTLDPMSVTAAIIGVIGLLIMVFYSKIRNKYFQLIPAPMWIIILSIGLSFAFPAVDKSYPLDATYLVNIPNDILANLAFPNFSKVLNGEFIAAVFAITLIASIESLLSIKAIDKLDPLNRRSNVNRDLRALGLATSLSGLLGGLNVVTVIARSSVNVNNGGTNRSANFFHAIFLLAFVLLFQEQLKRIPLAALAAILVYTGYKLATPKTFSKVAKIGKEQIMIFLLTLITTLFTNLITGISVGILVTFVIHIIINKSFSLFVANIAKPNVLLFKERDGGIFYISVKYFCNFLNFYRLKSKLDMVPENENVVLDFSQCVFVDATVMEGLENYTETFDQKGGSVEIIGLDKHGADSKHPFALRKILPFEKLIPIGSYFTKRQALLEGAANEFNWSYAAQKNTKTKFLQNFIFFRTRQIPYYYNTLSSQKKKFSVLDVDFTEGAFIAREEVKTTVMHIQLKRKIPVFVLDKEGLLDFIYGLAGFRNIDIKHHPNFNRRFFLSGENKKDIQDLFSNELILFFESSPYYHVESNGESILILKKERFLSVTEIKAMIYFGKQLYRLLQ